jgi:hypothetical protein
VPRDGLHVASISFRGKRSRVMICSVISAPDLVVAEKRIRPVSSTVCVAGFADVVQQHGEDERGGNLLGSSVSISRVWMKTSPSGCHCGGCSQPF